MKSQTLIIKVDFDEDDKPPHLWNWTEILECKDCVKVLNHGAVEASENKYHSMPEGDAKKSLKSVIEELSEWIMDDK